MCKNFHYRQLGTGWDQGQVEFNQRGIDIEGVNIMVRQPRFVLPGHQQHVIQRGNNRNVIFIAEADYQFYLEKLKDGCEKYSCEIHA